MYYDFIYKNVYKKTNMQFQPSSRSELQIAVDLYRTNREEAIEQYGEQSTWDLSRADIYGLQPETKIFKPTSKDQLLQAVNTFHVNKENALEKYGDIDTWDTSLITDTSESSKHKSVFKSPECYKMPLTMMELFCGIDINKPLDILDFTNGIDINKPLDILDFTNDISINKPLDKDVAD